MIAKDNYTLKPAVFRTVSNTIVVVVMLPLAKRLALRLIQLMSGTERPRAEPLCLNGVALTVPAAAIEAVRQDRMCCRSGS